MSGPSENKSKLALKGKGNKKWEAKHTAIITTGIISLVQQHRAELYNLDGIIGEVDGHGNNRTLQCIDRLMKAFAIANNVDTSVLEMGKKRRTPTEGGGGKKKRVKKEES